MHIVLAVSQYLYWVEENKNVRLNDVIAVFSPQVVNSLLCIESALQ